MKARLLKLWESRSPRDRVVIAVVAALVLVTMYVWLVHSAYRARAQLGASVSMLRAHALRLNADAYEVERLRAARPAPPAQADLRTLVQAQIAAAGLSRALLRIDAPAANQVQVVFGSVAFADWLACVKALQAQRIRLDTSRIEALSTPGLVGVTATFVRAKEQ